MSDEISTSSSVREVDGLGGRALHWLLLGGNRLVVAGGIVLVVAAWMLGLVLLGVVAIGPGSTASTAFASGLVSGTLTLVTVALSINQLILSRVFGSPNELFDKLDGTRRLRNRVRVRAGVSTTPNDPAAFLSLIAGTLRERATALRSAIEDSGWTPPPEVERYLAGIDEYGENIDAHVEDGTNIVDVLDVIIGTEYARNLTATEHLRNEYDERLSEAADAELDAIDDLLEAVAVTRQFFKTLSLQQDFARLSRVVAYSGLAALVASLVLALIYRTNSVTIPPRYLPAVFTLGIAVIAVPLAAFIAYVLRAATIARRTVSVGPFVPPAGRSDDGET